MQLRYQRADHCTLTHAKGGSTRSHAGGTGVAFGTPVPYRRFSELRKGWVISASVVRHAATLALMVGVGGSGALALWSALGSLTGTPNGLRPSLAIRRLVVHERRDSSTDTLALFTTDQAFRAEAALPDRVFALGTSYMPVGEGHMRRETAIGVTGPDAMLALRPTLQRGRYYDRQSAGTAEPPCLVAPAMAGPSSNPVAIGDRLHIGGIQCQVIGVLGDAFGGVFPFAAAIWLPMTPALVRAIPQGAGGFPWLALYAAGEDADAAAAIAQRATEVLAADARDAADEPERRIAVPLMLRIQDQPESIRMRMLAPALAVLGLSVGSILLLSLANVILHRFAEQTRAHGIRLALGAPAWSFIVTAVWPSCVGLAVGALVAAVLVPRLVVSLGQALRVDMAAGHGPPLFAGMLPVVGLAGLLGLACALALQRWRSLAPLSHLLRGTGGAPANARNWSLVLVGTQAASGVLLTAVAFAAVSGGARLRRLDVGVDVTRTLMVSVIPVSPTATVSARRDAVQAALAMLARTPHVRRYATAREDPFRSGHAISPWSDDVPLDSVVRPDEEVPYVTPIGAGFFEAAGSPVIEGRDFGPQDARDAPRVAILNATLARQLFPRGNAVGRCVYLTDDAQCVRVVGVARGAWKGRALRRDARAVYVPESQARFVGAPVADVSTVAIASVEHERMLRKIQRALEDRLRRDADPRLRDFVIRTETLDEMLDPEIHAFRATAVVAAGVASCIVLLAWFGLWSLTSRSLQMRRRDIAIRRALGATAWSAAMETSWRIIAGIAVGGALALTGLILGGQKLNGAFYMSSVTDPQALAFAGGTSVLMAIGTAAAAWRAARAVESAALLRSL